MRSRTLKPFQTTNLVLISKFEALEDKEIPSYAAYGDALLVDPGCCSEFHSEVYYYLYFRNFYVKFSCVDVSSTLNSFHVLLQHCLGNY